MVRAIVTVQARTVTMPSQIDNRVLPGRMPL
jgi:hypothetical protein